MDGARLPTLSPDEQAHADAVRSALERKIAAAGGWISFFDFMQFALYAPGLGYYSAGAEKFGARGDFLTAPELHPIFARCLARQVAQVFELTGGREIVEFGAGSGRLAVDLALALAELGREPSRYSIVDVSADLRARQRELVHAVLGSRAGCFDWVDGVPAEPIRGAVIANELLDALPVERFRIVNGAVEQLGVRVAGDSLSIAARAAPPAFAAKVSALGVMGEGGYVSEFCPLLAGWIGSVAPLIARGALFVLDYGLPRAHYYHRERRQGTLLCHFRHRAHADPLTRIGLQDITAWVDFTALAEAGDAAALDVLGYSTQAHFLLGAGMHEEIERLAGQPARERDAATRAASRLLLPGEMGEAFKVMALGRGVSEPLVGFTVRDLRHTL
jgi:SAM-dependent MidA family methyltransferase